MATNRIDDLHGLLEDLFKAWSSERRTIDDTYRKLHKVAGKANIEPFIRFTETNDFINARKNPDLVFHYGILIYDNYDTDTSHISLIPFKYAYGSKVKDPLFGLNSRLGQSESNARDFLYKNHHNAKIMENIGHDGYVVFSHTIGRRDETGKEDTKTWSLKEYVMKYDSNAVISHEEIDFEDRFEDVEKLYETDLSVLSIFRNDIMVYNMFTSGDMYTGMKIIDVDVQGRSSAYLMVNSNDFGLLQSFMANGHVQLKIGLLSSAVRSLYTKIHSDMQMREAMKSAVSAIMSRNMSHNLGSHYLYYTKNQLAALANSMDEKGPEIRGAAKVLGYMQARMDYLATIVAFEKYPYGGVFLKGQIFDELTIDDFSIRHFQESDKKYKRTTNYLLHNLIRSENFVRKPVVDVEPNENSTDRLIKLQMRLGNEDKDVFTGELDRFDKEIAVKQLFSRYNVALPGGVMSIHAFFNVVENLIRNSAKYMKEDFKGDLVVTIAVNKKEKERKKPYRYEFVIYDNKGNAMSGSDKVCLLEQMNQKLIDLRVLDEKSALDKSSKGIKEMLFSTLWMRAYTYKKNESLADVLIEMDQKSGEEKFREIREHAFEYVAVDDNGKVVADHSTPRDKYPMTAHLGIRFELPEYRMMEFIENRELENNLKEKALNNFTDIICVPNEPNGEVKRRFTRVYHDTARVVDAGNENEMSNAITALKAVLDERFGDIDAYKLVIGGRTESKMKLEDDSWKPNGIYFESHLGDDWDKDYDEMKKYCYCESVSGGNFTKTMEQLCKMKRGEFATEEARYFGLKVKEAALTRITLIDERFYNDMMATPRQDQIMSFKNARLLNLKTAAPGTQAQACDLFDRNDFGDDFGTHFLSIHLGMVEKIVGNNAWSKAFGIIVENEEELVAQEMERQKNDLNDPNKKEDVRKALRAKSLMERLHEMFKTDKGEVFISVHSGRGNFSQDLEGPLRQYPFISVSSIESVLANSKFLLAQLFYNTVYIGKGELNG